MSTIRPPFAIISLPSDGLTIEDISARFIRSGERSISEEEDGLGLEGLGSNTYRISGPAEEGDHCAITWEVDGQSGSYEYEYTGTPDHIILPIRSEFVPEDFTFRLFQSGTEITSDITFEVSEVIDSSNPPDPDAIVSGWPDFTDGLSYLLLWTWQGITYQREWIAGTVVTSGPTRYIEILAVQPPFSIGLDDIDQNRVMFSVNFEARSAGPTFTWEEDAVGIANLRPELQSNPLLPGIDTFFGPLVTIPHGDGPFVTFNGTGGSPPIFTHGSNQQNRLSLQVIVTCADFDIGRSRIIDIYQALSNVRDVTI